MSDTEKMYDAIDAELWTFQWSRDMDSNFGEVYVDREEGKLRMSVYCADSDNPEDDLLQPLLVSVDVQLYEDPQQQIRELIHWHLCHEADEQLWFNQERPFYPHNEDGSMK